MKSSAFRRAGRTSLACAAWSPAAGSLASEPGGAGIDRTTGDRLA
jgi:hypothetical protein